MEQSFNKKDRKTAKVIGINQLLVSAIVEVTLRLPNNGYPGGRQAGRCTVQLSNFCKSILVVDRQFTE